MSLWVHLAMDCRLNMIPVLDCEPVREIIYISIKKTAGTEPGSIICIKQVPEFCSCLHKPEAKAGSNFKDSNKWDGTLGNKVFERKTSTCISIGLVITHH